MRIGNKFQKKSSFAISDSPFILSASLLLLIDEFHQVLQTLIRGRKIQNGQRRSSKKNKPTVARMKRTSVIRPGGWRSVFVLMVDKRRRQRARTTGKHGAELQGGAATKSALPFVKHGKKKKVQPPLKIQSRSRVSFLFYYFLEG